MKRFPGPATTTTTSTTVTSGAEEGCVWGYMVGSLKSCRLLLNIKRRLNLDRLTAQTAKSDPAVKSRDSEDVVLADSQAYQEGASFSC